MRYVSILVSLLLIAATGAVAGPDPVGHWHGVLDTPQGELVLIISIAKGEDGALVAELEVPAQAPGQKVPITGVTTTGDSLAFAIPAIGATYRGAWAPDEEHWTGVFTQGMTLPLTLERGMPAAAAVIGGLDGTWEGTIRRNDVDLRLILRVRTGERGTGVNLDSPDLGAMNLPVTAFTRRGDSVSFNVPAAAVSYTASLSDGGARLTGQWIRPGQPAATVTFSRTATTPERPSRERPQMPREPFPYDAEEVRFDNPEATGVTLAGTLTLPRGDGPFPAAILITGSGAQDRDETIFGHKPFAVLADHLTRHGIAVLRYDDRGFAASTGNHEAATSADFATDANAAARYLLTRREIDPTAIGFVGHSEGGMIAPIAAVANEHIAFLVLLAGPGTSTEQLIESQRRLMGLAQGASEEQLDRAAPIVATVHTVLRETTTAAAARERVRDILTPQTLETLGAPEDSREMVVWQFTRPWYRYFLGYDPASFLSRIAVPVLAINGSLDQQVPPEENLAGIAAALSDNPDVTIRTLDGVNHMFQTARTGAIGEYRDIEETFAPVALEMVTAWILRRFGAS